MLCVFLSFLHVMCFLCFGLYSVSWGRNVEVLSLQVFCFLTVFLHVMCFLEFSSRYVFLCCFVLKWFWVFSGFCNSQDSFYIRLVLLLKHVVQKSLFRIYIWVFPQLSVCLVFDFFVHISFGLFTSNIFIRGWNSLSVCLVKQNPNCNCNCRENPATLYDTIYI